MGIEKMKVGHLISCDGQRSHICSQKMWAKGDILNAARAARWIVYPLAGPRGNHQGDWTICRHCAAQIAGEYCMMVEAETAATLEKRKEEEEAKRPSPNPNPDFMLRNWSVKGICAISREDFLGKSDYSVSWTFRFGPRGEAAHIDLTWLNGRRWPILHFVWKPDLPWFRTKDRHWNADPRLVLRGRSTERVQSYHRTWLKILLNPALRLLGWVIVSHIEMETDKFIRYELRKYAKRTRR